MTAESWASVEDSKATKLVEVLQEAFELAQDVSGGLTGSHFEAGSRSTTARDRSGLGSGITLRWSLTGAAEAGGTA